MVEGNFYHNFLGWDYAVWFSGGLFVLWLYVDSRLKKRNKVYPIKQKIISRTIGVLIALHFIFVEFVNPHFFGLGSPVQIEEIYFTEDYICLFDTTEDRVQDVDLETIATHVFSRIHIIDKANPRIIHTERLGKNFTYNQLRQEILFIQNSANPRDGNYYLKSVYRFDFESKSRALIAKQSGFISAEGKSIKVFKISIDKTIQIQNKQADVYEYDQDLSVFRSPDSIIHADLKEEVKNFRFQIDENADQVSHLTYAYNDLEQQFIYPDLMIEFVSDNINYCLVKSYEDLTKQQEELAVIAETGELKWKKSVLEFEHAIDVTLGSFDLIRQDRGKLYLTSGSYIIECDALNGTLNWWIKL